MKENKSISFKKNKKLQNIALVMALHCVRNTIIEDYHSQGKLTDSEMKAFNIMVVNKIYSFLELLSNPALEEERKLAYSSPTLFYEPVGWDAPEFDKGLMKGLEMLKHGFDITSY